MSSDLSYPSELLLTSKETPERVLRTHHHFTGCQEDTQALGLKIKLSVRGRSHPKGLVDLGLGSRP